MPERRPHKHAREMAIIGDVMLFLVFGVGIYASVILLRNAAELGDEPVALFITAIIFLLLVDILNRFDRITDYITERFFPPKKEEVKDEKGQVGD